MPAVLARVTNTNISIGGVNKTIILPLRCLRRIKVIVVAARARKLRTIQGAITCSRVIHKLLIRKLFSMPEKNNQLSTTGMGARISDVYSQSRFAVCLIM